MSQTSEDYFGYRDAKDYANKTIGSLYPKGCDRVKINKKSAVNQVALGHMAGEADMALSIMHIFLENVDEDYDILLGELQLLVRDKWNTLSRALIERGSFSMRPLAIEKLIDQSESAIKAIREEQEYEGKGSRLNLAGDAGNAKESGARLQ